MDALATRRILVVEDEFLIATMLCDMLAEVSAVVVGPSFSVQQALQALCDQAIDAAILDMNLNGEWSDPVAEELGKRGIPFVFTTGYRADERAARFGARIVAKPYDFTELGDALALAIQERIATGACRKE